MKRVSFTLLLLVFAVGLFAQAIQPSMMVMPSKTWCFKNGFERVSQKENGKESKTYEYEKAMIEYQELGPAIRKIAELMQQRGFKLVDFQTTLEKAAKDAALEDVDGDFDPDPEMQIIKAAGTDLILRINWYIETIMGGRQTITYELTAFDSYTGKQVANTGNTSNPQPAGMTETMLLGNAVIGQMDQFVAQLMSYFMEMTQKGREVSITVQTTSDVADGMETEINEDGDELSEVIDDWIKQNAVQHRFHKAGSSAKQSKYDSVYIPLYDGDNNPISAEDWVKGLRKHLKKNYGVSCKIKMRGLGDVLVKITNVEPAV